MNNLYSNLSVYINKNIIFTLDTKKLIKPIINKTLNSLIIKFGNIGLWKLNNYNDISVLYYCLKIFKITVNFNNLNISNVKSLQKMSEYIRKNYKLNKWNTSNVENMNYMFNYSKFNSYVNSWNVSKVKYMKFMFRGSCFNNLLSNWNIENVIDMRYMFSETNNFNKKLTNWNYNKYVNKRDMFFLAKNIN